MNAHRYRSITASLYYKTRQYYCSLLPSRDGGASVIGGVRHSRYYYAAMIHPSGAASLSAARLSWVPRDADYCLASSSFDASGNCTSKRSFSSQASSSVNDDNNVDNRNDDDVSTPKSSARHAARPWDDYYRALVKFKEEQGHTNVPQKFQSDPSLAYFVRKQRLNPETLPEKQRQKLTDLGFDWRTRAEKLESQWNEKIQQLVDYSAEYGSSNVPRNFADNTTLGRWVDKQRALHRQGILAEDRVQKLEEMGFEWRLGLALTRDTSTHDKKWSRQYKKLVDYYREHGDCLVPARYQSDYSLGNWIVAQRSLHRKGLLKPHRIGLLEKIDFVFDINNTDPAKSHLQRRWEEMFDLLLEFSEKNGHVDVKHKDGALGEWVATQRRAESGGGMEEPRKERLLELGFQFTRSRDLLWRAHYAKLQKYHKQYGHCLVTSKNDTELAHWVYFQRTSFREGKMTEERQEKLEALGFVWRVRSRSSCKDDNAENTDVGDDKESEHPDNE